jgi:hypothetical protein
MDQPIIQSTVCSGVFKQLRKLFPEAELPDLPYCVRCDAPRKSKADLCRFKGDRNLFQFLLGFVHLFLRRFPPIYITRRQCHMVNSHCFTGLQRHAVAAKLESSMRSRYITDISSKSICLIILCCIARILPGENCKPLATGLVLRKKT